MLKTTRTIRSQYRDRVDLYLEILKQFPPKKRVLFSMYHKQGVPIKDIASILDICESSVARRLKTISKQVERVIKQQNC